MTGFAEWTEKVQESASLALSTKAKTLKAQGKEIVNLTAGEPDFNTPPALKAAGIKAIENNLSYYTDVKGIQEVRKAIALKFQKENGINVSEKNVVISNGAKQCLFNALMCLLRKGDEVIVASPFWSSYPELIKIAGGTPKIVETKEKNDFELKSDAIENAVNKKTKAVIINSPNNPAGAVYSERELRKIGELAVEKNFYIISDEIYEKIIFDEKHFSIASMGSEVFEKTITVNGISKSFACQGYRLGYVTANDKIVNTMNILQGHSTSNVNNVVQMQALSALTQEIPETQEMLDEFKRRREFIIKRLNEINGIICVNPKGAFYAFPNISEVLENKRLKDSMEFCKRLLENGLAVMPSEPFGVKGHLRISFASSMAELEKGMDILEKSV